MSETGAKPTLYYITEDQAATIASLENDVALRGFPGDAEGSGIEVLIFLPETETFNHESLIIDPGGTVISRTRIEEAPGTPS
jgi:hypothetical protein